VEAAAFVVYLDDARPQNASERAYQFFHANGFNRWSDKTVQFAICDNGVSAAIGEHSMLDGYVFRRLNTFVTEAIMKLDPKGSTNPAATHIPAIASLESYTFTTTPAIDEHISRVRSQVLKDTEQQEFTAFELPNVGTDFFRSYKCPPKSGMQLVIQLACRLHFGHNPAAFETISLNHFLKGRIDVNHVIWPPVAEFCTAAAATSHPTTSTPPDLRALFFEAAKTHANNLMRATRGQGIDRHFLSLEWVVRDGEEVPALFASPLYEAKSRPRLVMTSCLMTGALECGSVLPDAESFWIHFEPDPDRVRFSMWGPKGQTGKMRALIEESAEKICGILQGGV